MCQRKLAADDRQSTPVLSSRQTAWKDLSAATTCSCTQRGLFGRLLVFQYDTSVTACMIRTSLPLLLHMASFPDEDNLSLGPSEVRDKRTEYVSPGLQWINGLDPQFGSDTRSKP